ncbi:hypothetical protein FKM82_002893 [Ascaphus truei]
MPPMPHWQMSPDIQGPDHPPPLVQGASWTYPDVGHLDPDAAPGPSHAPPIIKESLVTLSRNRSSLLP